MASADVSKDLGVDRNENFYAVEHSSILFVSATNIQGTTTSEKFKQNSTLHWRILEQAIDINHEQNDEQEEGNPNVVGVSSTDDATAFN